MLSTFFNGGDTLLGVHDNGGSFLRGSPTGCNLSRQVVFSRQQAYPFLHDDGLFLWGAPTGCDLIRLVVCGSEKFVRTGYKMGMLVRFVGCFS